MKTYQNLQINITTLKEDVLTASTTGLKEISYDLLEWELKN